MPDVHLTWSGLVFWLELKTTKNNTVRLSPQQIAWNTAYSHNGGLSFILVKHLSSGDLILFEGAQSLEVGRNGLRTDALFRGSGFGDLWNRVRETGVGHLESVLSGLRGSGFGDPALGELGAGVSAPVPVPGVDPGLEVEEA